eukprot:TRINITY_DN303_c0_g1_i1.p1 TRINITY_DN303_c0_g1~~TRINITY_DN303_c0_g1_i1.p1  ORF type:complete len:221 (+),score=45.95 TRINITY_DN303_c0_g1_i1:68-664(+)
MDVHKGMYLCVVQGKIDDKMLGIMDKDECQFFAKRVVVWIVDGKRIELGSGSFAGRAFDSLLSFNESDAIQKIRTLFLQSKPMRVKCLVISSHKALWEDIETLANQFSFSRAEVEHWEKSKEKKGKGKHGKQVVNIGRTASQFDAHLEREDVFAEVGMERLMSPPRRPRSALTSRPRVERDSRSKSTMRSSVAVAKQK